MALDKIKPKFYVYGCKQLLHDLEELIDSAGEYEDSGRSTDDWLVDLGLGFDNKPRAVQLSWGTAINVALRHNIYKLKSIRDESIEDYPF